MRPYIFIRANALVRRFLVNHLLERNNFFLINEYPRSGGSWLGQMLSAAIGIPFPRNRLPHLSNCLLHGHYLYAGANKNVVVIWRDGRDVLTSYYYYSLFKNEKENAYLVKKVRNDVSFNDYDNIKENLPSFIEYMHSEKKHPRFSWGDFVRKWHAKPGVTYVKYEDLRRRSVEEFKRVVFELAAKELSTKDANAIFDKYSFERQSGRKAGNGNHSSFMRKGIVGDWQNHFSPLARKVFNQYAGKELILLGYENDESWIHN